MKKKKYMWLWALTLFFASFGHSALIYIIFVFIYYLVLPDTEEEM